MVYLELRLSPAGRGCQLVWSTTAARSPGGPSSRASGRSPVSSRARSRPSCATPVELTVAGPHRPRRPRARPGRLLRGPAAAPALGQRGAAATRSPCWRPRRRPTASPPATTRAPHLPLPRARPPAAVAVRARPRAVVAVSARRRRAPRLRRRAASARTTSRPSRPPRPTTGASSATSARASWARDGDMLEFRIEADSFMRHMNRVLVGTMLEVAQRKRRARGLHPPARRRAAQRGRRHRAAARALPHGRPLRPL